MCVLLITQLLWLVGRIVSRKPVQPHQLEGWRYSNWPSQVGQQSLCNRSFRWRFCVVTLFFGLFCGCTGFCHRTYKKRLTLNLSRIHPITGNVPPSLIKWYSLNLVLCPLCSLYLLLLTWPWQPCSGTRNWPLCYRSLFVIGFFGFL